MYRSLSRSAVPTPAEARLWLVVYTLRHGIGLALYAWLTVACFQMHSAPLGWMLVVLTPLYGVFAFVSMRKLIQRYRLAVANQDRRRAAAAARNENGS